LESIGLPISMNLTTAIERSADRGRDRHCTLSLAPTRRVSPTIPAPVSGKLDVKRDTVARLLDT
jgi:hypothetical protein